MKKIILSTSIVFVTLLVACGKSGIEQISLEEVEEILESGNEYVLIYKDNNEKYKHDVEKISTEQNKNIKMYNIHETDGESRNNDGGWVLPDQHVSSDTLYKVEDGELVKELILTDYEGTNRIKEIEGFLE